MFPEINDVHLKILVTIINKSFTLTGSLAHDSSSADTSTGFATVEESNVGMKKNNRGNLFI